MNSTLRKDREELLKSPGKNVSRNCLKKSSSYIKKNHIDNENSKTHSNSIIQTSNKDNKQVINSLYSSVTNLRDKNQSNDMCHSQKRKNNHEDTKFRERDLNLKHKSPMCDRECRDKGYKWEIVYKKENTSPVDMKYKNG